MTKAAQKLQLYIQLVVLIESSLSSFRVWLVDST